MAEPNAASDPPAPPAYEHPGPCAGPPRVLRGSLVTSNTADKLSMTLTLPGSGAPGRAAPWPVVAFFNGFQVSEKEGGARSGIRAWAGTGSLSDQARA